MPDPGPQFRVYYADRPPYDGDPFNAPVFGVLVIVERDKDHGRRLVYNGDYYIWDDCRWFPVDYPGLLDYLQRPGPKRVLIGRYVANELWEETRRASDNDPDFPIRTAYGREGSKVR